VLAFLAGASVMACFDLFHSTNFETGSCALDGAACEDAAAVPPVLDAGATPRELAQHACAWLGACAGAAADDAFGPCMFRATLAYDDTVAPSRPVIGAARLFWSCLASATSCAEVLACADPNGVQCQATADGYLQCDDSTTPAPIVTCSPSDGGSVPPPALESCTPLGQSCLLVGTVAACSGASEACASAGVSCDDAGNLHDCDPEGGPFDLGVSCASFGAGACVTVGSGLSACTAIGVPGSCAATSDVACEDGGFVTGCPAGAPETVNCQAVLGLGCSPTAPGRAWDVSRACYNGTCGADSCSADGTMLTSCARGATVTFDCASHGLGPCTLVTYAGDPSPHAQCGAPDAGAF
jgi:hypothetical protein